MNLNFKESFINGMNQLSRLINKNAPEILAGTGIACWLATTVSAVKTTPKAVKMLEKRKEELNTEDLEVKETVKTVGKLYLPSIFTGVAGTCFVMASVSTSNSRYLALSTSYRIAEEAARTYRDKVIETIGEKKEKAIRDSIAQDNVDKNPPEEKTIIMTNAGNTLFKESYTGQYFRSDINTVKRKAIDLANNQFNAHDTYVGMVDWLMDVGEGQLEIPESVYDVGWSLGDQFKAVTVDFSAIVAHKYNDEPCLVINYDPLPISDSYYIYSR